MQPSRNSSDHRRPPYRPFLESLEVRRVPSGLASMIGHDAVTLPDTASPAAARALQNTTLHDAAAHTAFADHDAISVDHGHGRFSSATIANDAQAPAEFGGNARFEGEFTIGVAFDHAGIEFGAPARFGATLELFVNSVMVVSIHLGTDVGNNDILPSLDANASFATRDAMAGNLGTAAGEIQAAVGGGNLHSSGVDSALVDAVAAVGIAGNAGARLGAVAGLGVAVGNADHNGAPGIVATTSAVSNPPVAGNGGQTPTGAFLPSPAALAPLSTTNRLPAIMSDFSDDQPSGQMPMDQQPMNDGTNMTVPVAADQRDDELLMATTSSLVDAHALTASPSDSAGVPLAPVSTDFDQAAADLKSADLVTRFQPMDPAALTVVMQQYLDQVASLGDDLAGLLATFGPSAWIMTAAISVTAVELVRQRRHRRRKALSDSDTAAGRWLPMPQGL